MLDKITIIIPSYERQNYLKKIIKYWTNSKVKIIILDGSKKKIDFSKFNYTKNIRYFHFPKKSLFERLGIASDMIKTEYSILCCDDELYLENGLLSCLKELEKNKDLSCVMGRVLCFRYRNNKNKLVGFPGYTQFKNYHLFIDDPLKRIGVHLSDGKGRPTMYSLTRTIYLKEILKLVSKDDIFPCQQTYELQMDICLAYFGKIKFIEELTWLRNFDEKPLWPRGKVFFTKWFLSKKSKKLVNKLLDLTSKCLHSVNNKYNPHTLSSVVNKALTSYSIAGNKGYKTPSKIWSASIAPYMIDIVKVFISEKLIYKIKKFFNLEVDILDSAEKLKQSGVKFKISELQKAVKILNK